ncbi:glycerophosphoryl diester phosphodiesterase membrane domain-containing protein [Bacillus sp. 2205SS5-2]|uniref:glycerophosphoryl diester phosphodiesterase membrane domain-containing protein n=1 Tax=Bacillus sp. 2205SS5-2 TaxID=3109031 RepID=UPI003003C3BF
MNSQFNKPKGFGEILDLTFRLSKNHFKHFLLIFLILIGPIFLVQALMELLTGTNFFREVGTGSNWFEQIISSFDQSFFESEAEMAEFDVIGTLMLIVIGILSFFLVPIADAAVLIAINHIRLNEEYTVKNVIKKAFTRYWAIIGSTLLFWIISFGIIVLPAIILVTSGFFVSIMNIWASIIMSLIFLVGFGLLIGYLLIRWSFYFGAVVLEDDALGLSRSWQLTRNRGWVLIGLFITLFIILGIVGSAFEFTFGALLGNSVLFTLIVSLVTLFTSMVNAVAFAVIFFDLRTRHDGDDLKELIHEYDVIQK